MGIKKSGKKKVNKIDIKALESIVMNLMDMQEERVATRVRAEVMGLLLERFNVERMFNEGLWDYSGVIERQLRDRIDKTIGKFFEVEIKIKKRGK